MEKRVRGDLIKFFWNSNVFDKINSKDFFALYSGHALSLRRHKWKLNVNKCRLQLKRCLFSLISQRVISMRCPANVEWNKLSPSVSVVEEEATG